MVSVPRNKLAFPQSISTTLRFVEKIDIDLGGTDSEHTAFLANGMYDPRVALGGLQPRGFDEFMKTYTTFTVLSSSLSMNVMYEGYTAPTLESSTTGEMLKAIRQSTTSEDAAASPVVCGIHKGLAVMTAGAAEVQMEKDRTLWRVISPVSDAITMSSKLAVSDFYGKGKLVGATGYTGTDSADPTEKVYWDVWFARASGHTQGKCKLKAYVTIQYNCIFTEPRTLGAS